MTTFFTFFLRNACLRYKHGAVRKIQPKNDRLLRIIYNFVYLSTEKRFYPRQLSRNNNKSDVILEITVHKKSETR